MMFSFVLLVANLLRKFFLNVSVFSIFPLAILYAKTSYFHFYHIPGKTFVFKVETFFLCALDSCSLVVPDESIVL